SEKRDRARELFKPVAVDAAEVRRVEVDEPDMYAENGRSFMTDLYRAKLKNDFGAMERLQKHHEFEIRTHYPEFEKRAVATGTVGGLIPPQYLVDLYAKAAR